MRRRFRFLLAVRRVDSSIARPYLSFAGGWRAQLGLAVEKYRRAFGGQLVTQLALEQPYLHSGVVARQAHSGVFRNYDARAVQQNQECRLADRFNRVATDNRP